MRTRRVSEFCGFSLTETTRALPEAASSVAPSRWQLRRRPARERRRRARRSGRRWRREGGSCELTLEAAAHRAPHPRGGRASTPRIVGGVPADLAIIGARIRTLDPARPFATAVAVQRGTIVAVGDEATVREHCDARTEVLDARGRRSSRAWSTRTCTRSGAPSSPAASDLSGAAGRARRCSRRWRRASRGAAGCSPGGWTTTRRPPRARSARRSRRGGVRAALGPAHRARHARARSSWRRSPGRDAFPTARRSCASTACRPASCARSARRTSCCAPRRGCAGRELRARHVEQLRRLNALGLTGAHVMDGDPGDPRPAARPRGHRGADAAPARPAVADAGHDRRASSTRGSRCATRAGGCGAAAWRSSSPTA